MCLLRAELCRQRLPICLTPRTAFYTLYEQKQGSTSVSRGPEIQLPGSDSAVFVYSSVTWASFATQLKSEPTQCGCLITAQSN